MTIQQLVKNKSSVITIDVFGGPKGKNGFRSGTWKGKTKGGNIIKFFASIPHNIPLTEQQKQLMAIANK